MHDPNPGLDQLTTPCILLDEARMMRNIRRLAEKAETLGVTLRPHLKTAKSIDVARRVLAGGDGPATVSTLAEAEVFAEAGVQDILYAVGITPQKLPRVLELRARGCDLVILSDSLGQAQSVAEAAKAAGKPIPALIEIDSDGHRGGLSAGDPDLIKIGQLLHDSGAGLRGVMTHAGESYGAAGSAVHAEFAGKERDATVAAAQALRAAGLPCPVVSVGSTPTAHATEDLTGVTELRAGVYMFFDLVMAGIGVCETDDIALSVLTTVIGHQKDRGWILVDAGWMAMSRDRGTASQAVDQGYGVACDIDGRIYPDLIMPQANQEHGILALRPGSTEGLPDLPVGTQLRLLPNHACATAAQHGAYHVIPEDRSGALMQWNRFGGW
ncbi:alanine racemase (plasmid) [Alloyangia pacifica]|uniref:Alanine racemase n=1 Tax=Alloyangia pacifica TaxID=311180 RepID=A0A2U8HJF4_9RHOB|nr:DSD1 family PLP-dependent enzyme [Alloyangia pacifica]AWI85898.1 alanine racemase [Alloyangia pacifica]